MNQEVFMCEVCLRALPLDDLDFGWMNVNYCTECATEIRDGDMTPEEFREFKARQREQYKLG